MLLLIVILNDLFFCFSMLDFKILKIGPPVNLSCLSYSKQYKLCNYVLSKIHIKNFKFWGRL